jgi:hypothetical protein
MNSEPLSQVETEQGEGQTVLDQLQGLETPPLRLVRHGPHLGPAAGHVGEVEALAVVAAARTAVVADKVDLDEADLGVVPLSEGAYRDLASQQAAGLGAARAAQGGAATLAGEQPIDGRGGDREQLLTLLAAELDLVVPLERRHELGQEGRQALAADAAGDRPALAQRRACLGAVDAPAIAPARSGRPGRGTGAQAQEARRVAAVVAGERAEFVEHAAALTLAGAHVALRHLLGDLLPRCHRQGHAPPPPERAAS